MRYGSRWGWGWIGLGLMLAPGALLAQEPPLSASDSLEVLEDAKREQGRFESYRESRIPPERGVPRFGQCADIIGRFCIFFDEDGSREYVAADEPIEVEMARKEFLDHLSDAARQLPGDDWILGQRFFYLFQDRQLGRAVSLARNCQASPYWCLALEGYAYQSQGDWMTATEKFEAAFELMPATEVAFYRSPEFLLDRTGRGAFDDLDDAEREAFTDYVWTLSDPLYLVEGNDRLAEHYARKVLIRIQEEAENTWRMDWGEDMEEMTIRYGANQEWAREKGLPNTSLSLEDNRSLIGLGDPRALQYVAPEDLSFEPAVIEPESWELEYARPRSSHVAPYAPEMNDLSTQVARLRRGDSLFVVAAFEPAGVEAAPVVEEAPPASADPFGFEFSGPVESEAPPEPPRAGEVRSGLLLVPESGGEPVSVEGSDPSGTLTLMAEPARYVVGVEVFDEREERAWRDRHGLIQNPLPYGVSGLSDLILLQGEIDPPDSFEEALPVMLPTTSIHVGDAFTVAWEVYGLQEGETAEVTIGIGDSETGFLERVGGFLGLTSDDRPVVMTWEEAAPDDRRTIFRSINLAIPELEPAVYELRLEVDVRGREAMVSSRKIRVLPPREEGN